MTFKALALALTLTTPLAGKIEWLPNGAKLPACDVRVDFGSYASGTDGPTEARVRAYVDDSVAVTRAQAVRWGREGEWSLCLSAERGAAGRVYSDVKAMVPAKPRGPVTVTRKGGGYEK